MIKTVIVDDSVVYRSQIRAAVQQIPGIEVVGVFSSGRKALEKMSESSVDLVILDLEMPEMSGLEVLKSMSSLNLNTSKVIVFSATSQKGAEVTFEALRSGASDFVAKPSGESISFHSPDEVIKGLLFPKIFGLFPQIENYIIGDGSQNAISSKTLFKWSKLSPEVVLIASSTGGPRVLEQILKQVDKSHKFPIVIVQHMPATFTKTFSQSLSKMTGLKVKEAEHNEELLPNNIYLAPGDYHLTLQKTGNTVRLLTDQSELVNSVRPAADNLFKSAAQIYKENCLAFVLSGMGQDGKTGAESLKGQGAFIVVQEFSSCVVAGMPKAVFASGAYDRIENPDSIARLINDKVLINKSLKEEAS